MTYQVKGWDDHFESAKSRQFKTRNQVYLPNKHGLGYRRLVSSKNGEAMFGAWVAMCQVLSRQSAPRGGWITDDGTQGGISLTAGDIAMMTGYSEAIVEQMLVCCASQAVAWLSVNDSKVTSGPCQGLAKDLKVPVTDSGFDSAGEGEGEGKGKGKGKGEGEGDGEEPRPPVLRYTYQQVMQAADTVVMKQEDAERFYAHYAAVDFIDGAGRKITSLPHALAKWKANQYSHGKVKDGAVGGAKRFPDTPQALKLKIEAAEQEIRAMPSYHQDRTEAHCKRIDELKRKIKEWHNAMVE